MSPFVILVPARSWLDARSGPPATLKVAEEALAARLELVLTDPAAAEEAAVLEALALEGSVRRAAITRLGMASRSFYNILDRPGMQERADAQAKRLGHVLPSVPRTRVVGLDFPGLTGEERATLQRVYLTTQRGEGYQTEDGDEGARLARLHSTHHLLKRRETKSGPAYRATSAVLAKGSEA